MALQLAAIPYLAGGIALENLGTWAIGTVWDWVFNDTTQGSTGGTGGTLAIADKTLLQDILKVQKAIAQHHSIDPATYA